MWFERRFELGLGPEVFPELLERIRGTPARLEEWASRVPPEVATRPGSDGTWSIQEHVGHLGDLEPLWARRLDDLLAGAGQLHPADLENRATHEAGHNDAAMGDLLSRFRRDREAWVRRLEPLSDAQLGSAAEHPRLRQPMSVVDLLFFVAEHDDHHLATIAALARVDPTPSTSEISTHG